MSGIWTHNFSGGDRHWLQKKLLIQLPYNHDHDGHLENQKTDSGGAMVSVFAFSSADCGLYLC